MGKSYFISTNTNILENKKLRDPQIAAYAEAYNHFINEEKSTHAIIVLPTGVGKTGLMAILPFNISEGRILIIAPQLTILSTVESALNTDEPENFWSDREVIEDPKKLPVLIVYDGKETRESHMEQANIVLVNVQKLQKRNYSSLLNQYPEDFFDMIIIDEAHHSEARTWLETLDHFSNAKVVKITATPYRTDKKRLTGELIYKYKLSQAMSMGYVKSLEKFDYIPEELFLNIEGEEKNYTVEEILSDGRFDEDWIARSVVYSDDCKQKVIDHSVSILNKKKSGSSIPHKIIAAAPNIEEAKKIASMYNEIEGINAVAIDHTLAKEKRDEIFNDIDNNRYNVLVNVNMMGEGYDHKYLSIAAIFRVFKSLLPYEQFIGRILRAIPKEEQSKAEDNIGSVVVHKNLNLDSLWEYYKEQVQESEFITELREVVDTPEVGNRDDGEPKIIENDFGRVSEQGQGELRRTVYTTTEYLILQKKEDDDRKEKIKEISKILNVSRQEAAKIVDSQNASDELIKRPDLVLKQRKRTTDKNIKEQLVPELLTKHGFSLKGNNLGNLEIFRGQYSWIPSKFKENGAMLAVYFNSFLKKKIGRKRENWLNEDFERAAELLDQQAEYVDEIMKVE